MKLEIPLPSHGPSRPVLKLAEQLHRVVGAPFTPQTHWVPTSMDGPWNSGWQVAALPRELLERKVELVVSANDTEGIAAGLSGSSAVVLDFDDTFSPTWANVLKAYANLEHLGQSSKAPSPILLLRPRPLFLLESHVYIGGREAIAGLLDLSVYLVHRRDVGGLYVYLPKLETLAEAVKWDALLTQAELTLSLPPNTIRVGIQIETLPAAFQAEALLYTLRRRAFGLNAGRWDYVFSLAKQLGHQRAYALPEREKLGMEQPFLQAYEQLIVRVSHRHGAQAIGGSAALVPDSANPGPALTQVAADKAREAALGFDAAWAGHPDLVEVVSSAFSANPQRPSTSKPLGSLLNLKATSALEPKAVRDTLRLALNYLAVWLEGQGVLVQGGRTEDIATAELARTQLWQWVYHQIPLVGANKFDALTYQTWRAEEVATLGTSAATLAGELLDQFILTPQCPDYFTRLAYPFLNRYQENRPMNLQQLNQLSETEFTQTLGAIFEHSPWVAEQAWAMRPFDSLEALHTSMCHMVEQAPHDQQLALICAHPDLGAKAKMAEASVQEQKGAGLDQLSQAEFNQLHHYNQNYKTRFEFPFILAVKGKNKHDILSSMAERLSNDPSTEFRRALQEIYKIAGFRLHDLIKQGGGE